MQLSRNHIISLAISYKIFLKFLFIHEIVGIFIFGYLIESRLSGVL